MLLASLANDLSAAESQLFLAPFAGVGIRMPASVLRNAWTSPRTFELARKMAFQDLSFPDYLRTPLVVYGATALQEGALQKGKPTPEQEAVFWQVAEDGFATHLRGKLDFPHALQLVAVWTGVAHLWTGVGPLLEPSFRGPLAYVLGLRYLRLRKPKEAADFFRAAVEDAAPKSELRRLARAELGPLESD
jgi:hypothetical protein